MAVREVFVACGALKAATVSQGNLGNFWAIPLGIVFLES